MFSCPHMESFSRGLKPMLCDLRLYLFCVQNPCKKKKLIEVFGVFVGNSEVLLDVDHLILVVPVRNQR